MTPSKAALILPVALAMIVLVQSQANNSSSTSQPSNFSSPTTSAPTRLNASASSPSSSALPPSSLSSPPPPPPSPSASPPASPPASPTSASSPPTPSPPPPSPSASASLPPPSSSPPTPSPPSPSPSASLPPKSPSSSSSTTTPSLPPPQPSSSSPSPHQTSGPTSSTGQQTRDSSTAAAQATSATTNQRQSTTTEHVQPTPTSTSPGASAVDGNWAEWGEWICSDGCGSGMKLRKRSCSNPAPSGGGRACVGAASENGVPCKPCPETNMGVTIPITSRAWNNNMKDPKSTEYKEIETNIKSWANETFGNSKGYKGIYNLTLTQGSVIADFELVFSASGETSDEPQNYEEFIKTAIKTGRIANLTVDTSKLQIEESVPGVSLGEWKTDRSLCAASCCPFKLGSVYQNRTCTPGATSCFGVGTAMKIDCKESECTLLDCIDSGGITVHISTITMLLCVLASLRIFQ